MPKLAHRGSRFPDLLDWSDSPWTTMMPFWPGQSFRIEDFETDGNYVIRAELAGLDPDKDIDVVVQDGVLSIHAERREEKKEGGRSEFRYGTLTRSMTLPAGADAGKVRASYDKGILEVKVPISEAGSEGIHVGIEKSD